MPLAVLHAFPDVRPGKQGGEHENGETDSRHPDILPGEDERQELADKRRIVGLGKTDGEQDRMKRQNADDDGANPLMQPVHFVVAEKPLDGADPSHEDELKKDEVLGQESADKTESDEHARFGTRGEEYPGAVPPYAKDDGEISSE